MLVVGLTGGISSGKSMVAKWFREAGILVLDADEIVKTLQSPHSDLVKEIGKLFGEQMIAEDGSLNRQALGSLIFHDDQAKEKLNRLIHPQVKNKLEQGIQQAHELGEKILVLDIPLLYESGFEPLIDISLVVYVSKEIQLQRLMERDQIDEAYALAKINSQLSLEEKKKRGDFILDNRGTLEQLKSQFEEILTKLSSHQL